MSLPEGLREALGQVIAGQRREWQREREVIQAQARETIADLRASVAELKAENVALHARIEEAVRVRLAGLKDGENGSSVTVDDVAPMLTAEIDRRFGALPVPRDGTDAKPEDIERAVQAEVERRLAEIVERATAQVVVPEPMAGRDADMDQVRSHITAEVERVVAEIPQPKDGDPGKDADPEVIRILVAEAVAAMPAPEPGKDADPEVMRSMVAEAVAALPPAPAGKDADPAEVRRLIDEAVAALPPAEPGKPGDSVTVEDMRPLIEQEVARTVAELPKPKDGDPGKDGKLPIARAWTDAVHYEGAVVTHDGATWQAQRDTGRAPPHEDWACIAAAGRPGADGRSMSVRGTWSESEAYHRLDVVALNGAAFAARRDDPGPCPGDGWQMISAQGKRGNPGEIGKGLRGDRGPAGQPVVAMDVDAEGMLTLTNGDGTTVTLDLYPLLSKVAHS